MTTYILLSNGEEITAPAIEPTLIASHIQNQHTAPVVSVVDRNGNQWFIAVAHIVAIRGPHRA